MFKGLFIGIDRYANKNIDWLNCAEKDAMALHALFSDNLGGECNLLIGKKATKQTIEEQLNKLCDCDEDDVVFIAYSGHGSDTHEIITYDASPSNLKETSISLEDLTNWFSKIPSKQMIFLLDCCFSGGMGSKVFHAEAKPRALESTGLLLDKLSGEGRVILTASSPEQPAWETQKTGHGLLTHNFIEALLGPKEIVKSKRISFYQLVDYVTEKVTASAQLLGKEQNPTFRGKIDKSFDWPVFSIGENYSGAFPEYKKFKITPNLNSLLKYGFDNIIIESWSKHIPSLNDLQIDAINNFNILSGDHIVVSAPTSSGKTMIGELASLRAISNKKRALFLLPMKALVNDKHAHFTELYGEYGLKIIQATGDSHDNVPDLIKGQYDICLMTYEKFTSLVLGYPHILEQTGTIVIDEVQMIADRNRGANLEFILTVINSKRKYGIEPQLIALSAVIGDTNGLEKWLDARLLKRTDRPVPLDEGILNSAGTYRYIKSEDRTEHSIENYISRIHRKGSSQDWIIPLVGKLVSEGKQVIVFREMKGLARGVANYLSGILGLDPAEEIIKKLPEGDPSIISKALRGALQGGVAFHTADLEKDERKIIEESFREKNSKLRVIAATTTLAMGVNTPAEAVIIAGLDHPGPSPVPYYVAEYKNMVGRAGRLGKAERGYTYLIAIKPREEAKYWKDYVLNEPEDIESKFFNEKTDTRSLIVKVLVTARNATNNKLLNIDSNTIIDFLKSSFGAYQRKTEEPQWELDENDILQSLNNLETHDLVLKDDNNKYKLTRLGWLAGQGIIEVESVVRLVDVIKYLRPEVINDPTLITLTQLTTELSQQQLYFPLNSRGARKELGSWSQELRGQNVPQLVIDKIISYSIEDYPAAAQTKKAAACLLWISSMKVIDIENILTRHDGLRKYEGVAGPIRSSSSRTKDMIRTVARIVELIHPQIKLSERSDKLFNRLETGTPSSINEIAKKLGNKLSRAEYHNLLDINLTSFKLIDDVADENILNCVSGSQLKLRLIRKASKAFKQELEPEDIAIQLLPEYED